MNETFRRLPLRQELIYLVRYAGSGVVNTLVGFLVIFSAMALGVSPILSNTAGYVVGFALGFFFSKKFVFRSEGHFMAEGVRYVVAFIFSFLFNLFVLHTLTRLGVHVAIAQVGAAASFTMVLYLLTRLFVFNGKNNAS